MINHQCDLSNSGFAYQETSNNMTETKARKIWDKKKIATTVAPNKTIDVIEMDCVFVKYGSKKRPLETKSNETREQCIWKIMILTIIDGNWHNSYD